MGKVLEEKKRVKRQKRIKDRIILTIGSLLMVAAFLGLGISLVSIYGAFLGCPLYDATLVEITTEHGETRVGGPGHRRTANTTSYFEVYEFIHEGKTVRVRSFTGSGSWPKRQVGQQVRVYYNPRLDSAMPQKEKSTPYIGIAFAVVGAALAVIFTKWVYLPLIFRTDDIFQKEPPKKPRKKKKPVPRQGR